jgi:DNA polymerase-3 subunit beta
MAFNGRYLLEMLNHILSNEVRFTFSRPERAALIYPNDDDNTLMLLMPVMITQNVPATV